MIAHALRNSLIPVVTIIGLQLGAVLTGHDHHRDDLRVAGRRPAADSGDQLPRLSARAGLHPVHRRDLRRDEPARRPRLRVARSEDSLPDDAPARPGHRDRRRSLAAVVGPWLVPARSDRAGPADCGSHGPSWAHPLGLDELGRDVLARLLVGRAHLAARRVHGRRRCRRSSASPSARSPATSAAGSTTCSGA